MMDEKTFVASLADMEADLTFHAPSVYHRQVKEAGKPCVDWWPSKGTCQIVIDTAVIRGPKCFDFASLLEWMKSV